MLKDYALLYISIYLIVGSQCCNKIIWRNKKCLHSIMEYEKIKQILNPCYSLNLVHW